MKARIAGVFYLLTIMFGVLSLAFHGNAARAVNVAATLSYVAVTVLFYVIFKPVSATLSLAAAMFSGTACVLGLLSIFGVATIALNPLALFGWYCLTIGYLIIKSDFLPSFLGVLMMIGGLSWMTFTSASLGHQLMPYNMAPGIIGEGALTLWLLVFGVKDNGARKAQ